MNRNKTEEEKRKWEYEAAVKREAEIEAEEARRQAAMHKETQRRKEEQRARAEEWQRKQKQTQEEAQDRSFLEGWFEVDGAVSELERKYRQKQVETSLADIKKRLRKPVFWTREVLEKQRVKTLPDIDPTPPKPQNLPLRADENGNRPTITPAQYLDFGKNFLNLDDAPQRKYGETYKVRPQDEVYITDHSNNTKNKYGVNFNSEERKPTKKLTLQEIDELFGMIDIDFAHSKKDEPQTVGSELIDIFLYSGEKTPAILDDTGLEIRNLEEIYNQNTSVAALASRQGKASLFEASAKYGINLKKSPYFRDVDGLQIDEGFLIKNKETEKILDYAVSPKHGKRIGNLGKGIGILGDFLTVTDVVNIAREDYAEDKVLGYDTIKAVSSVGGEAIGQAVGVKAGKWIGGAVGACFGGAGAVPGAIIGCFLGGFIGGIIGGNLAEKAIEENKEYFA